MRVTLLRVGGAAAAAAAVLLAVLFWPGGGGRTDVVGRARAAMGTGAVMHVVGRSAPGYQFVQLDGGRASTPTDEWESWSDRSLRRQHVIVRERGRIIGEFLRPDDPGSALGEPDPAFAGLWAGYRPAFAHGTAKLVGNGNIYGHRVYWLRFAYSDGRQAASTRVAVDRDSFRPIALWRFGYGGGPFPVERVLLARTEPFAGADFRRRTPPSPPSATGVSGSNPRHPVELASPWLTAGPIAGGLKLAAVAPLTVRTGKRKSPGVELSYGSASESIRIDEQKVPPDPSWNAIPAGFVRILPTEVPSPDGRRHELWMGALRANGIYVTIQTTRGRDGLLAVARALKSV